jgi:2-keto-4-pentenoate hydratase/2-oxohepta-3-ene-1,7-dioic acid hydratase in catechol pathway
LVTYMRDDVVHGSAVSFGAVVDGGIVDLGARLGPEIVSVRDLLERGDLDVARDRLAATAGGPDIDIDLDAVTLLPPVPDARKVFGIGLNYAAHRDESRSQAAEHPTVFTRLPDSHVGHGQPIVKPAASDQFDYEGELAVVIGRRCHQVAADRALAHVAGYAAFNDGSVRDWQFHSTQWIPGKNWYRSGAFGPWLVTADELTDITAQTLTTRVNGEVRQQSPIADLIFDVPTLVAYISSFTPLLPGDVIATGTPSGVGAYRDPPEFLAAGDVVEVEITGIGTLRNPVIADEDEA